MSMARMRVEIRPLGRADSPLPKAHGRQAVQMRRVRAILRPIRSLGVAYEAPSTEDH